MGIYRKLEFKTKAWYKWGGGKEGASGRVVIVRGLRIRIRRLGTVATKFTKKKRRKRICSCTYSVWGK